MCPLYVKGLNMDYEIENDQIVDQYKTDRIAALEAERDTLKQLLHDAYPFVAIDGKANCGDAVARGIVEDLMSRIRDAIYTDGSE